MGLDPGSIGMDISQDISTVKDLGGLAQFRHLVKF